MDSKKKTIIWVAGLGCGVLILGAALLGLGGYWLYRQTTTVSSTVRDAQQSLGPPKVALGKGFLTSSVFASVPRVGAVTDIAAGRLDPRPGVSFVVAGTQGAAFLQQDGTVASSLSFPSSTAFQPHAFYERVDIADVEGDGICEFYNRDTWAHETVLLNHDGSRRWSYKFADAAMDDACAGDVDGDGISEFVVGYNGDGGVHLVNADGTRRWRQPSGNVWHVEIADLNGDGRAEILHTGGSSDLTVLNGNGATLATWSSPDSRLDLSKFSLVSWPNRGGLPHVIVPGANVLGLLDGSGKLAAVFDAPQAKDFEDISATLVLLQPKAPPYLAVLLHFELAGRSILYVYDPQNKLIYRELLGENAAALATLPLGKTGIEALLVGGEDKVYEYVIVPSAATATSSR